MNEQKPTILPTQHDPPPPPPTIGPVEEPEDPTDPDGVPTRPSKPPGRSPMPSRPEDVHDVEVIDRGARACVGSWGPFAGCAITR